jgi:hypothetical protein
MESNVNTTELPVLSLRIGFAGKRNISKVETESIESALVKIYTLIVERLIEINSTNSTYSITKFYAKSNPQIRLITGLAEGSDELGSNLFDEVIKDRKLKQKISGEHVAVIPFEFSTYRNSRPESFQQRFDKLAKKCSYIINLDGIYDKPTPDTVLAKNRRNKAYRAQSTQLLRQSDLIIAIANPEDNVKAGGTLETIQSALKFNLPVIFINSQTGNIEIIEPHEDLLTKLNSNLIDSQNLKGRIKKLINFLVLGSTQTLLNESLEEESLGVYGEELLHEFFQCEFFQCEPSNKKISYLTLRSFRGLLWGKYENLFRPKFNFSKVITELNDWHKRSKILNYYYSGLYRGTFLLNHFLAVFAVFLATLTLLILGQNHTESGKTISEIINSNGNVVIANNNSGLMFYTLLFLSLTKLFIVIWIFRNTHEANHGNWNEKSVDYRYLAEKLRAFYYLLRVGSVKSPSTVPAQYTSRLIRQSAIDWLYEAIIRSISPVKAGLTVTKEFCFNNKKYSLEIMDLKPIGLITAVKDKWIQDQLRYHTVNSRTMYNLYLHTQTLGKVLNLIVIALVSLDLVIVFGEIWHLNWASELAKWTPLIIFPVAFLPAAVAGLNGIRFQSECLRLAERSAIMRFILCGKSVNTGEKKPTSVFRKIFPLRKIIKYPNLPYTGGRWLETSQLLNEIKLAQINPNTDLGCWATDVLLLTEKIAHDFLHEVTEWSVVYTNEILEP